MFLYSSNQVICHTNIECSRITCHDVYIELILWHRKMILKGIPTEWQKKKLRYWVYPYQSDLQKTVSTVLSRQYSIKILMKIKTGSKNSKIGTPRIEKVTKPIPEKKEKAPKAPIIKDESIPAWVRESSEKKPKRAEWAESKLQWRKETKKSQRSFSKNKEREYSETKPKRESAPSDERWGFRNTFDKAATYEWEGRRSSWDPTSKKPGTGFEKSKTGYKGVGSAWDKSTAPRVSTRTWDDVGDKPARSADTPKRVPRNPPIWGFEFTTSRWRVIAKQGQGGVISKDAPSQELKTKNYKTPYIAPKPTWEKETEIIDKKKLVDPTK